MSRFYYFSAAFAIGIAFGTLCRPEHATVAWAALLSAAITAYSYKNIPVRRRGVFVMCGWALALVAAGMLRVAVREEPSVALHGYAGKNISAEALVIAEPVGRESYAELRVEIQTAGGEAPAEKVLALARVPRHPEFSYGDRLVIDGKLEIPKAFETDTGRIFDYPAFLAKDGVSYIISYAKAELDSSGNGNFIKRVLFQMKAAFVAKIGEIYPEPHASLLSGILFGERNSVGDGVSSAFKISGVSHIIVLSGYNIAIVAAGIHLLFSRLSRMPANALGGLGIVLFVIMSGAEPSVVRAGIMALIALSARTLGRRSDSVRALAAAGIAMLIHNPSILVHDPSFQLSFLATAGIVLINPHVETVFRWVTKKCGLRELVSTTISAQISVLPLLLYMMGSFGAYSLPANVLILPLVPILMFLGAVSILMAFVLWPLALVAGFPAYAIMSYVFAVTDFVASLPFASVPVPAFPAWMMVACYGAYAAILWKMVRTRKNNQENATLGISAEAMEYELIG